MKRELGSVEASHSFFMTLKILLFIPLGLKKCWKVQMKKRIICDIGNPPRKTICLATSLTGYCQLHRNADEEKKT